MPIGQAGDAVAAAKHTVPHVMIRAPS
jgi:hypothetical protein